MSDTERVAYVQFLHPDRVDEYREVHEDVPDAVRDAMDRGGCAWFDLFVRDEVAICVAAVEDPEEFAAVYDRAIEADERVREWEELTSRFAREGVETEGDEKIPFAERIWTAEFDRD